MDGDGKLSRKEVVEVCDLACSTFSATSSHSPPSQVLKAQLPIDYRSLEREAANGHLWDVWDKDGNGYLDERELLGAQGVVSYVCSVFAPSPNATQPVPDIKTDRMAWFAHFDEDGSGCLDKGEVVRALIKTLSLTPQMMDSVCEAIDAIWCIFDHDSSGSIERTEFLQADVGLADTIIAQLGQ